VLRDTWQRKVIVIAEYTVSVVALASVVQQNIYVVATHWPHSFVFNNRHHKKMSALGDTPVSILG
jgi:hypothetical protein